MFCKGDGPSGVFYLEGQFFRGGVLSRGTVPPGCVLSGGTVPPGCVLSAGTVPPFNLSLLLNLPQKEKGSKICKDKFIFRR